MLVIRCAIDEASRQQPDGPSLPLAVHPAEHLVIRNAELYSLQNEMIDATCRAC
jgi:hypothetical protein